MYSVLIEIEVSIAVVVYPAAIKVVVYVTTTVIRSVLVLGAAIGVHAVPGLLEGMVHLRESMWIVGELEG